MDQRKKDILNAPYFHVVFTMPEQLHTLIYHNQKLLYDLMYKAVAETLMELSQDQKYLGAQIEIACPTPGHLKHESAGFSKGVGKFVL